MELKRGDRLQASIDTKNGVMILNGTISIVIFVFDKPIYPNGYLHHKLSLGRLKDIYGSLCNIN